MKLTVAAVKQAKPKEKPYKMADGGGLHLYVTPAGSKIWRVKYRVEGREKLATLGRFPELSLADARIDLAALKAKLRVGQDPAADADSEGGPLLETVADEWYSKQKASWSEGYAKRTRQRLDKDIVPVLGKTPINSVTVKKVMFMLSQVESRGAVDMAHRLRGILDMIFRYAIVNEYTEKNPAGALRGALTPHRKKHYASIIDPEGVGGLLRSIEGYQGSIVVRHALQLAPHVFVRPGELRTMQFSELDFSKGQWEIPAEKMKMKSSHIVPLSKQALAIIESILNYHDEPDYIFPSARSDKRPISDNAVLTALRTMGYGRDEMTGHGFRAMARTLLDEELGFPVEHIEQQLAHVVKDPLGRAYNRTKHLKQRFQMMQAWSDYLDGLRVSR